MSGTQRMLGAATALLVAMAPSAGHTDAVADFYKGKQVNVVVGYGPGGGYDVYTRLLLRHMPRHVPGNPTMVVQNMPGAGSLRAANYVGNAASRDGLTLGVFGAPAALEPLFGNKDALFETAGFAWLGNMIRDTAACGTWHNSGITSLDQIINAKKEVVFGASGAGSYANQHSLILKQMLGANLRVITAEWIPYRIGSTRRQTSHRLRCSRRLPSCLPIKRLLKRWQTGSLRSFSRKTHSFGMSCHARQRRSLGSLRAMRGQRRREWRLREVVGTRSNGFSGRRRRSVLCVSRRRRRSHRFTTFSRD